MGNEQAVHTLTFDGTPLPGMTVDVGAAGESGEVEGEGTRGVFVGWAEGQEEVSRELRSVRIRTLGQRAPPSRSLEREKDVGADEREDAAAAAAAVRDDSMATVTTEKFERVSISGAPRLPFSCAEEEACFSWVAQRAKELFRKAEADSAAASDKGSGVVSDTDLDGLLLKHDSYILGFLQVATKCRGAEAAWSELDVEAVASQGLLISPFPD